jgi:hypothetical protein
MPVQRKHTTTALDAGGTVTNTLPRIVNSVSFYNVIEENNDCLLLVVAYTISLLLTTLEIEIQSLFSLSEKKSLLCVVPFDNDDYAEQISFKDFDPCLKFFWSYNAHVKLEDWNMLTAWLIYNNKSIVDFFTFVNSYLHDIGNSFTDSGFFNPHTPINPDNAH